MKKERRKQPAEIETSYRSLIESIKDYAIFMLDKDGKILSWDQGGVKLFGYTRGEIIGKNFSVLFVKGDIRKGVPKFDLEVAVQEFRHLDERQYVRKDKTKFWSSGALTSTRNKEGVHLGFSKIMRDVTEQTNLHRTVVHNSTHDFLTGLPNRSYFEENLIQSIPKTKEGNLLAVLYMDFNNFKRTNDEFGNRYGDMVLIEIAHRLSRHIRLSDVAARFGGDEFVIVAKQLQSQEDVSRFAGKILKAFKPVIVVGKRKIQTSVSIGVAVCPDDSKKPSELLRFADLALYEAKKSGGNQHKLYSDVRKPRKRSPR